MTDIQVWFSEESTVLADWFIAHSDLGSWSYGSVTKRRLYASDGSDPKTFYLMPARLKDILYLDCPDLVFTVDDVPFASLEISEEAGSGHNAFQRFGRVAAAVENGVAAFYIYPQAAWITRKSSESARWDRLNPTIFQALDDAMRIHDIPALLYYNPTEFTRFDYETNPPKPPTMHSGPKGHLYDANPHYPKCPDSADHEMTQMFDDFNRLLVLARTKPVSEVGSAALRERWAGARRRWMAAECRSRMGSRAIWSPMTATTIFPTSELLGNLALHAEPGHTFGDLLPTRAETLVFHPKKKYRTSGDPYTGVAAALDYMKCRTGVSYEDRDMNLVVAFGEVTSVNGRLEVAGPATVDDYVEAVRSTYSRPGTVLLSETYGALKGKVPRYMMQVRHGTTYTKRKDLRMFAYFCDAILFPDGSLWREA